MSRLFLIAASGPEAREHLEISLVDGVELDRFSSLTTLAEELADNAEDGRVFLWGANPGSGNLRTWERLAPGDVGLVYSQAAFPFCARVYAKVRSQQIAESIWGSTEEWGLLYFVERPRQIGAPLDQVREALGYSPNWIPQGFSFLGEDAERRLTDEYGGFEGFLDEISTGPSAAGVAEPPEIGDAVEAVAEVSQGRSHGRQMSGPVRRAVELHAMDMATDYYADQGWEVEDVSARQSYDLLCVKPGKDDLRVEVKGTTSSGVEIPLTRNEVANARAEFPNVALVVVAGIQVDHSGATPSCSAGYLRALDPWSIDGGELAPIAFSYEVPYPRS